MNLGNSLLSRVSQFVFALRFSKEVDASLAGFAGPGNLFHHVSSLFEMTIHVGIICTCSRGQAASMILTCCDCLGKLQFRHDFAVFLNTCDCKLLGIARSQSRCVYR